MMLAANLHPLEPYKSSSTPWISECLRCKKTVKPSFNNVKSKGGACPYCAGNAVHIDDVTEILEKAKLKPLEVFPGSKKPWKCKCLNCGETVSPTFSSVKQGGGCRFCARKKVGLANKTNEREAINIMKAAGLKPLEPYLGSGIPWKCRCMKCKNVITPRLSMVKSNKSGCAYCAGVRVDEKEALKILKKNKLKPLEPYKGNKHPWKCIHIPCGKTVSPRYNGLQKGQGPCKYCAHTAVHPGDAVALFISNQLKPLETYSGNSKKPWRSIHIPCGNEVSPTYNIIQRGESIGCHFCSDQFVDPVEAFQFFLSKDLQPSVPYPGSSKPWKSIHLICGSQISPRYGHIKAGRKGCPVCAGVVPISQKKAFAFFRENGLEPLEEFKGPHRPWKSIHIPCGRKVSPRWANVQQGASGCVYCSGNKVDMREVKLLLKKLELKPLEPYPGGKNPWRCIHLPCGREVTPRYNGLSRGQGGCEFCGKNVVSKKEANELLEKFNYKPLQEFPGGSKPWKVLHEICGSENEIFATSLRQGKRSCSACSRTKPITKTQAFKFFKSRGFEPTGTFHNAKTPITAIHLVCGKEVSPSWSTLKYSGGCKYCSTSVVNLISPAYFYLITNKELNAHKIGISSYDASVNRIERHKRLGWNVFATLDLDTGEDAYILEDKVLTWLRADMQLPRYLLSEQMPQGGHTETVDASEITLDTIWKKIEELNTRRVKTI